MLWHSGATVYVTCLLHSAQPLISQRSERILPFLVSAGSGAIDAPPPGKRDFESSRVEHTHAVLRETLHRETAKERAAAPPGEASMQQHPLASLSSARRYAAAASSPVRTSELAQQHLQGGSSSAAVAVHSPEEYHPSTRQSSPPPRNGSSAAAAEDGGSIMTTQTTKRRRTTLQDGNRTSEEPHVVKKTKLLSCTECKVRFQSLLSDDAARIVFCSWFLSLLTQRRKIKVGLLFRICKVNTKS